MLGYSMDVIKTEPTFLCFDGCTSEEQLAAMWIVLDEKVEDPKKLLRCSCGFALNFTEIRKCAECEKPLCFECAKPFRGSRYCKPHRKARADAASKEGKL